MFWILLASACLILILGIRKAWLESRLQKQGRNAIRDVILAVLLAGLVGAYPLFQLLQPNEVKTVVRGQEEIKQMIRELPQQIAAPTYYSDGIPQSTNLNLKTLFQEGQEYLSKYDFDKAIKAFRAGLALQGIKPSESAALFLFIGNIQYIQNKWDEAIGNYTEALNLAKKGKDDWGQATCLTNLGAAFVLKGERSKAIQFTDSSLKMNENLNDSLGMAHAYNNLGMIYQDSGEYDLAIRYYNKSLEIKERIADVYDILGTYSGLGTVYLLKDEITKAKEYVNKILTKLETLNEGTESALAKKRRSQIYNDLGGFYLAIGDSEKARECYKKSLKIKEEIGDEYGIAYVKGNIGHVYKIQGKKSETKKFLRESINIFEHYGDNRHAAIARKQLEGL